MKPEIEVCVNKIRDIVCVNDVPNAAVPSMANVTEQSRKRGQLAFIIRSLFVWNVRDEKEAVLDDPDNGNQ